MIRLTLGTRGSALALAQADLTTAALAAAFPGLEIRREVFITRGDQKLDLSLLRANEAGGKGLFTKELEDALLDRRIDVAVHSLKDLPGQQPPGLALTAVLERAPTADVLITRDPFLFEGLPHGARIGTSSIRRARQLQWLRADLIIEEWRGNVGTRLRKLNENNNITGIILAEAGLRRLGFDWPDGTLHTAEGTFFILSLADHLLPAIGQGAIALQSRSDDAEVKSALAVINHEPTWLAIRAERELQRLLEGDCSLPVGVRTRIEGETLHLSAVLFAGENAAPRQASASGPSDSPEACAQAVFAQLAGTAD
jgi:hydroxymethylbilane synthase